MGEYDVMKVDPSSVKQAWEASAEHDPVGLSPFSKALSTATNLTSIMGPTADVALSGSPKASGIFNSFLSGFAGQGSNSPVVSWSTPGNQASSLASTVGGGKYLSAGMPGTAPGYTGSGGGTSFSGGSAGGSSATGMNPMGSQDIGAYDSQINSMMNNNLLFLAIQTKVQNVSQTMQLMSNLGKMDHEAKINSIRNTGH